MDVAILGGGPAGFSVGYYAKKYDIKFTIFEASDKVGGNCITLKKGDFLFDLGAHRLHDKNPVITNEIKELMKDQLKLINVPSQIFFQGKYIDFPLSPFNLLKELGILYCINASVNLLRGNIESGDRNSNFKSLALKKYGKTIAESFLFNYSEKLWGLSCEKLSPNISGNRLKGLDLRTFIIEAFLGKVAKTKHLDGSFYYPQNGYGSIVEKISEFCGNTNINLNSRVTKILHDNKKINQIEIGGKDHINIDKIVSTIPLNIFLKIMIPSPPEEILKITDSLRYRHLRLVAFFLKKESITSNATVYFPEANFPFTRIYEPKNRSSYMSPLGRTSLVAELPCQYEDEIWNMSQEKIINLVKEKLIYIGWIKDEEVINSWVGRINYAYPVLETDFEDKIQKIMGWLDNFSNLKISGRNGRFLYTHLHDQMKFGKEIIEQYLSTY